MHVENTKLLPTVQIVIFFAQYMYICIYACLFNSVTTLFTVTVEYNCWHILWHMQ